MDDHSGKDALLVWCQQIINNKNPGKNVENFRENWGDGIAFMKIANEAIPGAFDLKREAALGDDVDACKDRLRRVFDYNYDNM